MKDYDSQIEPSPAAMRAAEKLKESGKWHDEPQWTEWAARIIDGETGVTELRAALGSMIINMKAIIESDPRLVIDPSRTALRKDVMTMPDQTKQTEQTKHTPGPWITDDEEIYGGTDQNELVVTCVNYQTNPGQILTDTEKVNLRLIAAAPEMLEALEEMVSWMREYGVQNNDNGAMGLYEQARAAISKAKGE